MYAAALEPGTRTDGLMKKKRTNERNAGGPKRWSGSHAAGGGSSGRDSSARDPLLADAEPGDRRRGPAASAAITSTATTSTTAAAAADSTEATAAAAAVDVDVDRTPAAADIVTWVSETEPRPAPSPRPVRQSPSPSPPETLPLHFGESARRRRRLFVEKGSTRCFECFTIPFCFFFPSFYRISMSFTGFFTGFHLLFTEFYQI